MHTEFEGELKEKCAIWLKYCLNNKLFNLEQFNKELALQRQELKITNFVPSHITEKYLNNGDKFIMNSVELYGIAQLLPRPDKLVKKAVSTYKFGLMQVQSDYEW